MLRAGSDRHRRLLPAPEPCPGGAEPRRTPHPAMGSIYKEYFNRDKIREHYNFTKGDTESALAPSRWVGSVLIVLLCCFIVLENLLVLVSICRNKRLHLAMYIFIGNLAASDLLAGAAFMVNTLLSGSTTFRLTPVQWFVREGTAFATLAASVFSLLAIAIERHVAITKVKVYSSDKNCRMVLLIGACWLIAGAIGSLPIMGWNCISDLGDCSTVLPLYSKRYVLFVTTIFTLILLAIVGLYTRIYCVVRSSHAEIASAQTLALLKTVTIVLGAFIVCWSPAFIILLMDASCPVRSCRVLYSANYFFAFATLNSAANPVIYMLRSKEMRGEFLRVLCCCGRGRRRSRPPGRAGVPLRTSSSLDKGAAGAAAELPTAPLTRECTTCV
ncbi:PREDICTED: sphingosine 1-phosphate receptor 2 [Pseudopodoces humilis]|uniref:sphingosine 1-phosphate receptor 2 n=1 Tax=Pseudopodoces humilis TaxID=181119 RepID=UPI0006B86524|nr:PREDICTED: sphingosine 1-phosphate receptor 2 [Pseudopodoces humilis]